MTAVRVTAAQARRLGLPGHEPATPRRKGKDRSEVRSADCAPNVCDVCDVVLGRPVDEDRHLAAHPDHRRYESSLTRRPANPTGEPMVRCPDCRRYSHNLLTHRCGRRQA